MSRHRKARQLVRAMKETAFDWQAHNRDLDEALARWNATEAAISQLHIDTARGLAADIARITGD